MLTALLLAIAAAMSPPKPIDIGSWFSADDYPIEAMKKGQEGSVFFQVDVDVAGKPSACRIVRSSGSDILDQATCDAVRSRARFEPATDAQGKPVPGKYARSTVWRLDDKTTATYQAVILDFSADPAHPVCTIKTGQRPLGRPTCADIIAQASQQQVADRILKLVFLLSVGLGDTPPYQGEPEWGQRVSYVANVQYSTKGGLPMACIGVAAEGSAAGRDACAGFPGARTISEQDKAGAMEARTEQSIFAVLRTAPASRPSCDTGESAREGQGCD